jgi:hypothetical protein
MTPEFIIRFGVSLIMVVFGIHQMIKPQDWFEYIPSWIEKISPVSMTADMRLHALGNIVLGLFYLSDLAPKTGNWLVLIWWLTILPFAFRKNWAIGMRDLTIVLAILAHLRMLYPI